MTDAEEAEIRQLARSLLVRHGHDSLVAHALEFRRRSRAALKSAHRHTGRTPIPSVRLDAIKVGDLVRTVDSEGYGSHESRRVLAIRIGARGGLVAVQLPARNADRCIWVERSRLLPPMP